MSVMIIAIDLGPVTRAWGVSDGDSGERRGDSTACRFAPGKPSRVSSRLLGGHWHKPLNAPVHFLRSEDQAADKTLCMFTNSAFMVLAAGVGACIALQASSNGKFRLNLGSPIWASFFSICGTFITAISAMLLLRPSIPSQEALRQAPWWNWIGGPLGALIVLGGATLVTELSAAVFIALVVSGQLICSLLLDHFALVGLPHNPLTVGRVFGAALVVAGVVCMKYL